MTPPLPSVPQDEKTIAKMFDDIASRYDLLNRLLSARQDKRWRKHLVRRLCEGMPAEPTFLDVATGTGDVPLQLASTVSGATAIHAVDISAKMLSKADHKLRNIRTPNIQLHQMSAERLAFDDQQIDGLSISFGLRNVVDKRKALAEFSRVLKPGGRAVVLELFRPKRGDISTWFLWYFSRILPKIGALFGLQDAYRYLPASVMDFSTVAEIQGLMESAGFSVLGTKKFWPTSCALIWAKKA